MSHCDYRFRAEGLDTVATFVHRYESAEAMATVLQMGMEEGATAAFNQIDQFLAA